MSKKLLIGCGLVVVLFALSFIVGRYTVHTVAGASTPSATFSTQQLVAQTINSSATTTWASFLNGANDRFITSTFCYIRNPINSGNVALTGNLYNIVAGTSTQPSNVFGSGQTATDTILVVNVNLSTSTLNLGGIQNDNYFYASPATTTTLTTGVGPTATSSLVWPGGTYLNFVGSFVMTTATAATSTGNCGVEYIQL